uniref:RHS repeat domain-containing protein n=1 Tax=Flavobacterium columnare TaxID=996 RepID=UPI002989C816
FYWFCQKRHTKGSGYPSKKRIKYYPFGSLIPNRHGSSTAYRYGFNGKEKDDELKGEGNHYDYGMRVSDPRTGRFFSVDPLTKDFPWYTPYQFAGNTPIAAIDLDGEEPKIVITGEVTGTTKMHVYGAGNIEEITVRTYKAIVQYTDGNGKTTQVGTFNVTRDGWYSMGSDSKGNAILHNKSSDPSDNKKHHIELVRPEYYSAEPAFQISPINSPISSKYNKNYIIDDVPTDVPLPTDVVRENGVSKGAQIHIGGIYIDKYGRRKLAGTYGCYGIVDPSQVSPKEGELRVPSNDEMQRFSDAVEKAEKMQVKEHKKKAPVEVDIQKRQRNTVKTVKTNKRLVKG